MTSAARVGGPHLRGSQLPHERVVERTLPVSPGAARLARATAQVACRTWRISSACEVAVLAVSELVGNAVRHGGSGRLTLRLSMTPRRLRLEVRGTSSQGRTRISSRSPTVRTSYDVCGEVAGPRATLPSCSRNALACHGQTRHVSPDPPAFSSPCSSGAP